jgi:hypothetical protein
MDEGIGQLRSRLPSRMMAALWAVLFLQSTASAQAVDSAGPATFFPPARAGAAAAGAGTAESLNPAGIPPTPAAGWPNVDTATDGTTEADPLPAPRPLDSSGVPPVNGTPVPPVGGTGTAAAPPPPGVLGALPGAPGMGGMGLIASPIVGRLPVLAGYRVAEFFDAPVKDQNAHLGYTQQNINILTPIWQNCANEFSLMARVGVESFDTNAILPSTQQHFPAELWNIGFGPNYRHLFDNGWIGGGSVQLGSFSDKPFHGIDEMTISAEGFLRIPSKQNNAWMFFVAMSSNSQILPFIPIPGVAYLWVPSKSFQALVGFPFANVTWRPTDNLTFNVSYALLTNFNGRVSYQLCRQVRLFTGLEFVTQNYFRTGRVDVQDRFFEYYDQLFTGVQFILGPRAFFDLSGGYVFDRMFFEARTFTSSQTNRVNVDPSAFVSGTLQFRF